MNKTLKEIIAVAVSIVLVIGAIGIALIIKGGESKNDSKNKQVLTTPIKESSPSQEATSSSSKTETNLNRETFRIQVLNASEVIGAAAKAQKILNQLGFKEVTIGNAEKPVEGTNIKMREASDTKTYELLKSALESSFEATFSMGTLPENADFDATIILGK